jgi:hypothetical protein
MNVPAAASISSSAAKNRMAALLTERGLVVGWALTTTAGALLDRPELPAEKANTNVTNNRILVNVIGSIVSLSAH